MKFEHKYRQERTREFFAWWPYTHRVKNKGSTTYWWTRIRVRERYVGILGGEGFWYCVACEEVD